MKTLEIIFTLVAAILAGFVSYKWKEIDVIGKITLIAIIIAATFIAINSFRETRKKALIERVNAKFGEIKTGKVSRMEIQIGDLDTRGTRFISLNGVFDIIMDNSALIKLEYENDKLLINFIVRDLNGEVIAVIEDSEWTIFDNNYEYNNDDTIFEMVTKGERKVFFQIRYKEKVTYFTGFILNEKGEGFAVSRSNKTGGALLKGIGKNKEKAPTPNDLNIPRVFKYPRDKYLGVKL